VLILAVLGVTVIFLAGAIAIDIGLWLSERRGAQTDGAGTGRGSTLPSRSTQTSDLPRSGKTPPSRKTSDPDSDALNCATPVSR